MRLRDFRRAGHWPTLLSAFLYFDISFMVWILPGALANSIVSDFGLDDAQKGFLVAIPILGGAFLRLLVGVLTDRIGARRTGMVGLMVVLPVLLGNVWGLRGTGKFPQHLLSRPVRPDESPGRELRDPVRDRRFVPPSYRRLLCRSLRWDPHADRPLPALVYPDAGHG